MPLFAQMQCAKCEREVWVEAHGKRPWDGDCPRCKSNAWTWLGWTDDHMAAIRQTAVALGVELVAVHQVEVPKCWSCGTTTLVQVAPGARNFVHLPGCQR